MVLAFSAERDESFCSESPGLDFVKAGREGSRKQLVLHRRLSVGGAAVLQDEMACG